MITLTVTFFSSVVLFGTMWFRRLFRKKVPTIIKLEDGVTLIHQKRMVSDSASVVVWFKTGANDEKIAGMAHFAEHIFLQGTKGKNAATVREEHKRLSSDMNGATWYSFVNFSVHTSLKNLDKSTELLSEQLFNPSLDEKDIENEKGVLESEIAMWHDDERSVSYNAVRRLTYPNARHEDVLGDIKSVRSIYKKDILEHAKTNYGLDNMVVMVHGNISKKKAKKLVLEKFVAKAKAFGIGESKAKNEYKYNHNDKSKMEVIVKSTQKNAIIELNFPLTICSAYYPHHIRLEAVEWLLNGLGGVLMDVLREERGLIYGAHSSAMLTRNEEKHFSISIETSKEKINECLSALDEILKRTKFTQEKLDEYKAVVEVKEAKDSPIPNSSASWRSFRMLSRFGMFKTKKDRREEIKKLTLTDVNYMCDEIRRERKFFVVVHSAVEAKKILKLDEIERIVF